MLRVLLSAQYMIPQVDRFRKLFDDMGVELIVQEADERLSEDQLLEYAGKIDGAICGDDPFTSRVLELATPRLKVISKWGTGIDSIDCDAAARLGVKVYNTPDAFTDPVADSVMGYILAFARKLPWTDRAMKAGYWKKSLCKSLSECSLGVVGVGKIGKAVLRRAYAFGMRLMGNDIAIIYPPFISRFDVKILPLSKLLPQSDFVSLNCDLNPTSYRIINQERLNQMRRNAILINTSRGPVVDEGALINALQMGRIAGVALDVFENEPLSSESLLRSMDNVLLSPHNANSSLMAYEQVHLNTLRNLFRGLGVMYQY